MQPETPPVFEGFNRDISLNPLHRDSTAARTRLEPFSAAMASAMRQVLDNVELRENILLHCDTRDLLIRLQRVSHLFRNTIAASPRLQQKLHFRYITSALEAATATEPTRRIFNPLLERAFAPWFCDDRGGTRPRSRSYWTVKGEYAEIVLRENASWRRMLLSEPPVQKLVNYDNSIAATRLVKDGLTMGMLYDTTMRADDGWNISVSWTDPQSRRDSVWIQRVSPHSGQPGCCLPVPLQVPLFRVKNVGRRAKRPLRPWEL